jgi:bacillithiol synthase
VAAVDDGSGDARARARIVARARRPLSPDVHRALVAQNARLAPSPARDAHLAALGSADGAAAIVTGQQVGLFLGPLYTLYKAATAIALARSLAAETGIPVVPVFWLQTEDHDLAEIATCDVAAGAVCETVAVPVDAESRVSIAELCLPDAVDAALARLTELVGCGPNARAHVERLGRHYRAGATWADAFAGVLGELFAPEGLVVIDPRDPREPALAAAASPVHARAIEDSERIATALLARCRELEQASGQPPQVHVRPDAPLSFFHPDGAAGPRVRLAATGAGTFREVGGDRVFDRPALLAALAADPRVFSTSALLRPVVQDTLLPTAAYVGGPAEVAYFAQLPPLYAAFERELPLVVERAHVRIVDDRARRVLERLGITAGELEGIGEVELLGRLRRREMPDAGDARTRLLAPFASAHDALSAQLATGHTTEASRAIARALTQTRTSVERSISRFASRLERITAYEDHELVDAVRRARAWLAPDGELQERRLGLPCFAARLGDRHVVERVLATITPFDCAMQELS